MPSVSTEMSTTIDDVRNMLRKWDKGSTLVRESILRGVVLQCEDKTGPELEERFCDCASLFLARLTAWLRISYLMGTCLDLQLKAITIFISATSGQHFLTEFLEVGGMLTVLEIVGLMTAREPAKTESIRLLSAIANKGRQYKELLCESYGVKLIAECLALSQSEVTQEEARHLLHQLSAGNPRYQSQVYNALVALLSSASSEAQRMAAYTLRLIQPSMGVASPTIVDPVLELLQSLHLEVQFEATELLKTLVSYEDVQHLILMRLVGILKASDDRPVPAALAAPLSVHVQQAGAAKVVRVLADKSNDYAGKLIEMRVVPHLLCAMGNTAHKDSQRQSSMALKVFVDKVDAVREQVLSVMEDDFFQKFICNPEELHNSISPAQIDVLVASLNQEAQ
ncbi:armadillo-like helical domain containing protein 1 isoform X2 [Halichondria panicea]|uniref:armadillo-like helical domain containing protein 1 isoform X2 n=1 Tax=Halichondria panicea TaxID=6063 RepID=UPI00312B896D